MIVVQDGQRWLNLDHRGYDTVSHRRYTRVRWMGCDSWGSQQTGAVSLIVVQEVIGMMRGARREIVVVAAIAMRMVVLIGPSIPVLCRCSPHRFPCVVPSASCSISAWSLNVQCTQMINPETIIQTFLDSLINPADWHPFWLKWYRLTGHRRQWWLPRVYDRHDEENWNAHIQWQQTSQ